MILACHGEARLGWAGQGTRPGKAGQGVAWQGKDLGMVWPGKAGRGKARRGVRRVIRTGFNMSKPMKPKRITQDPAVMGGKPCIRGLRVTVGTLVGLVMEGKTIADILALYPYLEADDVRDAMGWKE